MQDNMSLYVCDICQVYSTSEGNHRAHMNGKPHKKKIRQQCMLKGTTTETSKSTDSDSACVSLRGGLSSSTEQEQRININTSSMLSTSTNFIQSCKLCLVQFSGPCNAADHFTSEKHKKKEQARIEAATCTTKRFCPICCVFLDTVDQFLIHNSSPKHLENEAKATVMRTESCLNSRQTAQNDVARELRNGEETPVHTTDNDAPGSSSYTVSDHRTNGRRSLSPDSLQSLPSPKRLNCFNSSTLFCELCSKSFSSPLNANQHYASERHRKRERQTETVKIGGILTVDQHHTVTTDAAEGHKQTHENNVAHHNAPLQLQVQEKSILTNFETLDVDEITTETRTPKKFPGDVIEDMNIVEGENDSDSDDSFVSAAESLDDDDSVDESEHQRKEQLLWETATGNSSPIYNNHREEVTSHEYESSAEICTDRDDFIDRNVVGDVEIHTGNNLQSVNDPTPSNACTESNANEGKNSETVKKFEEYLEDFRKQFNELAERKKIEWRNEAHGDCRDEGVVGETGMMQVEEPVEEPKVNEAPVVMRKETPYDYCSLCSIALTSPSHASQHRAGKKHKRKMQLEMWNCGRVDTDMTNDAYTKPRVKTAYEEIVATNEDMLKSVLVISPEETIDLKRIKQDK